MSGSSVHRVYFGKNIQTNSLQLCNYANKVEAKDAFILSSWLLYELISSKTNVED